MGLAAPVALAQTPTGSSMDPSEVVVLEGLEVTTTLDSYLTPSARDTLKQATPLRQTPFTVQVANAALIADLRAETLADVYPYITGLTSNGTRADSFSLRGFSSNRESVQNDGLPGNTTVFGSPPSANVEQIEVLKGPASVLYGALAPGGIVNLVTKQPLAVSRHELFTSVSSYAGRTSGLGDDVSLQATLDSGGPLTADRAWRYRLVARFEDSESFRKNVANQRLLLAPSVSWTSDQGTHLLAGLEYLDESGNADAGLVAPGNDLSRMAPIDTRYQAAADSDADEGLALRLNATHDLSADSRLVVAWRSVWHNDQRTLFENNALRTVAGEDVLRRRYRDQYNERQYHFLDARWEQAFTSGPVAHQLLLGFNGGYEQRWFDRLSFGPFVGTVSIFNPQTEVARPNPVPGSLRETWLKNHALYVSDALSWGDGWHGLVGLRYTEQTVDFDSLRNGDSADQSTDAVVPSVGLVRELGSAWSLYASYGESFIPASVQREDINGKTGLPPERAHQFETGLKYERADGLLGASFAWFEITQFDITESLGVANPNGNTAFGLVGEARTRGAELDLSWQPQPHLQVRAGYSLLAEREITAASNPNQVGATLTDAPRHQAHLWARYNVPDGPWENFGLGLGLVGLSEREVVSTTSAANRFTLPGHLRTDLALYYQLGQTSLALNVQNVFDRDYVTSAASNRAVVPGEPRNVTLSVRYRF